MITPMDIHNKTFSKGLRGYSEEEVNDFLRQIVADYEQIYREHREMEEQMDQMKTKLANYEKISETMTNTLQLAKDTAENVKKNAKRNAEILIANAHADDLCFRVRLCECCGALAYFIEKIVAMELRIISVCSKQIQISPLFKSRHYII